MPSKLIKMGAKETGESWRDNYITPDYILAVPDRMWGPGCWFDPCPAEPSLDGLALNYLDDFAIDPIPIVQPRIFVNPPFSKYQKWVDRWLRECLHPDVEQVWLCHTNNSSGWFKQLTLQASAICLLGKRVKFIDPRTGSPTDSTAYGKSQSLIYVGSNPDNFRRACGDLGTVWEKAGVLG